jgi:hypothetical protein
MMQDFQRPKRLVPWSQRGLTSAKSVEASPQLPTNIGTPGL